MNRLLRVFTIATIFSCFAPPSALYPMQNDSKVEKKINNLVDNKGYTFAITMLPLTGFGLFTVMSDSIAWVPYFLNTNNNPMMLLSAGALSVSLVTIIKCYTQMNVFGTVLMSTGGLGYAIFHKLCKQPSIRAFVGIASSAIGLYWLNQWMKNPDEAVLNMTADSLITVCKETKIGECYIPDKSEYLNSDILKHNDYEPLCVVLDKGDAKLTLRCVKELNDNSVMVAPIRAKFSEKQKNAENRNATTVARYYERILSRFNLYYFYEVHNLYERKNGALEILSKKDDLKIFLIGACLCGNPGQAIKAIAALKKMDHSFNINDIIHEDESLLHHSARQNNPGIVGLLLANNHQMLAGNKNGVSALQIARGMKHQEVVEVLFGALQLSKRGIPKECIFHMIIPFITKTH